MKVGKVVTGRGDDGDVKGRNDLRRLGDGEIRDAIQRRWGGEGRYNM